MGPRPLLAILFLGLALGAAPTQGDETGRGPALRGPALRGPADRDTARWVDPLVGTGGSGHTFPGASLPFGMVQLSPDTRLTGWHGCSGYHGSDRVIYGFSHTHLSGTGGEDYCDVLLAPATGALKLNRGYRAVGENPPTHDPSGYGSAFRKTTERARPGYYAVDLDGAGVKAELTAALRAGFHRYTFRRTANAHILLDLTHRDTVLESSLRVVDDRTVEGMRRSRLWAKDQPVHFVARFSRPFRAELAVDGTLRVGLREASGRDLKAVLRFDLKPGEQVLVKVGLAGTDLEGARRNLDQGIPHWDFERTRREAREAWNRVLGKVEVEGGTEAQRRVFYTALYHAFLQPNVFQDADGRYLGRDLKIHRAEGYTHHTVFSLWDTFRAAHPLYTLLEPERTTDFLKTFLAQAREGGRLPVWELWGNETGCMIGYHAVPVIADAWLKGFRGVDGEALYAAMRTSAMEDRLGLGPYKRFGYIPSDQEPESVSKSLEYAYDDWCIAQMAKALGKPEDHAYFLKRSLAYQHLFDPETGLLRPRPQGRWKTPFDPTEVDFNYTEANAWQYSFFVPHDVAGHMARLGGPEAYAAKLDALFSAPSAMTGRAQVDITGLIGQYAHGNEPSHHVAYLYAYAGQPWKTQALVRRILEDLYAPTPEGLCGNEDCGQMSAWYLFSALGFYPVNPCGGEYVIGAPLFRRATLRLPGGRSFTIRSQGSGPYVQSATLDGRPYSRAFLRHEDLLKGGELAFVMGPNPNRAWGSSPEDRPHSAVTEARVQPAPWIASGDLLFRGRTAVTLASPLPGARIHYTLDGSAPTEASPRYAGPLTLTDRTHLTFAAFTDGLPPSPAVEARFTPVRATGAITLRTRPNPQYTGGSDGSLVDGLRGGPNWRLGGWQGYTATDLDAVVDLGQEKPLRRVALGCLQDQDSWIFMPERVTFETSLDGQAWTRAGIVNSPVDPRQEGVLIRDLAVDLASSRARYVRVRATCPKACPPWHKGAGNPCHIFVDEIMAE